MTDPTQPDQPSEEEIRAYLQQVREADPAVIIVQAFRMLGEGAEIKLGRGDARVLIDAMNAVTDAVQERVPQDLVAQMRDNVRQLQMAQVQAEREQSGEPGAQQPAGQAPGAPHGAGPGGAAGAGSGAAASGRPGQPGQPGQPGGDEAGQKLTDRLWIPGRGPGT